jgi:DUF4097 and DUF4098 domain-containing protein YvlB
VPAGIPVSGTTSNGSIDLEDLGDIDVSSSNGAIELSDIAGEIRARTSNGRIDGDGIGAGPIDVESSNGAIELELDRPQNVKANTSNGRIELTVPEGSYAVTAETSLGGTDVQIPDDPDGEFTLDLRTSNGSIEVSRD